MVSTINRFGLPTTTGNFTVTGGSNVESQLQKAAEQNQQYLEQAQALYEPYSKAGLSSLSEYINLLQGGVSGLSSDKNFQDLKALAEKDVMANRAVSGLLRSTGTANTLDDTLLRFANDYYGNRLNQLQGGVQYGTYGTNAQANAYQAMGSNATDLASALANVQMQREGNQATIQAAREQAGATAAASSAANKASKQNAIVGAIGTAAGLIGGLLSDKRAKRDLKLVGKSNNGLNIYLGRYKKSSGLDDGKDHLFLIAQEVKKVVPDAVIKGDDGYYRVNYKKALGVKKWRLI